MRTAVFPGSFDPLTLGHLDIIHRAAGLFDKIYVAIGHNTNKKYMLSFDERKSTVENAFQTNHIEVIGYNELTVDLCRRLNAQYIVRGLRSVADFEYERNIALMNHSLNQKIETVFLLSQPEYAAITSTIVREIYHFGGDISAFVPEYVQQILKDKPQGSFD